MVALFDLIDRELATRVAERIGVAPPTGAGVEIRDAAGELLRAVDLKPEAGRWVDVSPALSQLNTVKGSIKSRRVAMLLAPGFDGGQVQSVKAALEAGGAHPDVVSLALGVVRAADGTLVPVDKTSQVAASVLYDAVFVPGGAAHVAALAELDEVSRFLTEAFKHGKSIGVVAEAAELLPVEVQGPGVVVGQPAALGTFVTEFVAAIGNHRFPEREGARGGIGANRTRSTKQ
jgi:catalase